MKKCILSILLAVGLLIVGCGSASDSNVSEYLPAYYEHEINEAEPSAPAYDEETENINGDDTENNYPAEAENNYTTQTEDNNIEEDEPEVPSVSSEAPRNVIALSAASNHTLALMDDRTLWSWGAGGSDWGINGFIGDGTSEARLLPVMIMENVIYAVAGPSHSLAITADGVLWAWGENQFGQLGDGTTQHRLSPVRVMEDVIYATLPFSIPNSHVGCVSWRSYAIRADGTLWAWGYNNDEYASPWPLALGDGTNETRLTPVQILDNVISVAPTSNGGYALTADGRLWWWHGDIQIFSGSYGNEVEIIDARLSPEPIMENVADILNGFAITTDGAWWELGLEPIRLMDNVGYAITDGRANFAITTDGTLWAWGQNRLPSHWRLDPILGDGTTIDRDAPVRIMENVASVTTMGSVTYAITKNGELWGWGNGAGGWRGGVLIGDGSTFSWADVEDYMGEIWDYGWEYSNGSQFQSGRIWLLDDDGGTGLRLSPVKIMENVVSVYPIYYMFDHGWINSFRTFALTECGSVWAWGDNDVFSQGWGLLGDGTSERRYYPVRVIEGRG